MIEKLAERHLNRAAFVYVRQSTLQQVRNNTESSRRQYGLEGREGAWISEGRCDRR